MVILMGNWPPCPGKWRLKLKWLGGYCQISNKPISIPLYLKISANSIMEMYALSDHQCTKCKVVPFDL